MARVSIFLIVAALIVGMIGCGSGQYSLAVHSTEGGLGWASGQMTEISNLDYGAVVQLGAVAYTCYEFVSWTGDVGTIADIENAYTTIIMKGSYVITANFAPKVVEAVEIRDWHDLDAARDNLCWNYTLMNDLDSSTPGYEELAGPMANGGRGWQPIGSSDVELHLPFKGTFDGQGYEIHDLCINVSEAFAYFELGLFGLSYGVIRDIGVVNATLLGVTQCPVGALVGRNAFGGTVSNSYSTGNVSAHMDYNHVGGLVGENSATVTDSYSTANVTGEDWVGGLIGWNSGTVSNSYSTGNVTGENYVGGLIGWNSGTVSNSFWDTLTSGQASSDGGTGKNTTEMQNIATFSGAGWNIIGVALNETNPIYIWNIVNNITYPFLSWQS